MLSRLDTGLAAYAAGAGAVDAARQAMAARYAVVVKQATLLAFVDTFRLFAAVALLCLPTVLLLRKATARGSIAAH